MGRLLGRGEKPTELGDSWLPDKEFKFDFKTTSRNNNQNVILKFILKRDSSLVMGTTLYSE